MKAQLGKPTGLALALLAALLATFLTMGVFSVAQAQTSHNATRSFSETTVAPGAEVTVTIELSEYGRGGSVAETLPQGFSLVSNSVQVTGSAFDNSDGNQVRVVLARAGVTSVVYKVTAPAEAGGPFTFTGNFVNFADESVAIGGDSMITVAADATGGNGEPSPVKLSTYNAGADVNVTINARADSEIRGGRDDIEVTLTGFGGIGGIDEDDVSIEYGDELINPSNVAVDGSKITLSIPRRTDQDSGSPLVSIEDADYTIFFKSSAGLTNPTYAGDKDITVSDADSEDEDLSVTIVKTVSVKPTLVTRGGDATVTAKGLRDGTTTVYLLKMDDDEYVRGAVLGSDTADDGVVEIEIDTSDLAAGATADDGSDTSMNTLRVIDANNDEVGEDVTIGIKPTVKLGSDSAKRSASLEISVSDWYYGNINKVTVGGIPVGDVDEDAEDGKATFDVTVPGNVRTGEQEVKVYGDGTTSATATVTISVLGLDVSPSTVVPGQRVTITGSGFAKSAKVEDIRIGKVGVTPPDDAHSTSSGRVAVTVTVPLNVSNGDMKVELKVSSRTGEGEITVPKPSIELNPSESLPGSTISVTGTGFASTERVEVKYRGDIEEVGRADSDGNFSIMLTVPSDAGIGATNPVVVSVRDSDDEDEIDVDISATADHKTPGAAITVPEEAQVGTLITISGSNFEGFSTLSVNIGGKTATPTPSPEADKNGNFELQARVPRLGLGSHTITVKDGSADENSVTETFTVVAEPVEPVVAEPVEPVVVVTDPAELFASLGSRLVRVWYLDRATQVWSFYDPDSNVAAFNTLTEVTSGMNVSIIISQGDSIGFQGGFLYQGTNPIALK